MMKPGDLIGFEPIDPAVQFSDPDEAAAEIERFLRDASAARFNGQAPVGLDAEECFDPDSVRWYRRVFDERTAGRHGTLSDVEFLNEWGFIVEQENRLAPTRAALLVFGKPRHLRQILPRPVVDCQFIDSPFDSWSPDEAQRRSQAELGARLDDAPVRFFAFACRQGHASPADAKVVVGPWSAHE